jgi:hypothetical protein
MSKSNSVVKAALLLCLSIFVSGSRCQADDVKARAQNVLERQQPDDYTSTSEAEKVLLRAEFKRYKNEDDGRGVFSRRAAQELVKLGDSETIEHCIREFLDEKRLPPARRAAQMLELATDPAVIPRLSEQIFAEDGVEPVAETDVFVSPKSILATNVIIAIGAKAPQLPAEARESLQSLKQKRPEERRTVLRRWWRENQSAFGSQQYSRVTAAR